MYSVDSCPVCSSNNFIHFGNAKDYTVSHETFSLKECATCHLVVTSPRPDDHQLAKYYDSPEYISHTAKATSIFDKLYEITRELALDWKLTLVKEFVNTPDPILLDYGCGTGYFLKKMQKNGFNIAGVEPSLTARTNAEKITNSQIATKIEQVSTAFDAITLWHVLEHVNDLNQLVSQLKQHLKRDGTLFIAVPNHRSADAKKYGMTWAGYDVPRHLWHFEQNTMTQLLKKHNLSIVEMVPMKLDAFYVSMLSEKYKAGKQSVLTFTKGLLNGLLSNLKAKDKNYSSIIYIARHE